MSQYLLSAPLPTPALIESDQLAKKLVLDIDTATQEVHLQTMDFDTKKSMRTIVSSLIAASARGVSVSLAFDYRAYSMRPVSVYTAVKKLRNSGVTVVHLGNSWVGYPIAGRSHGKMHVIDNVVYIGGGMNLRGDSFEHRDYMLRYESAELASIVRGIQLSTHGSKPTADKTYVLDADNSLIVDGGMRGASRILDAAVEMTKNAKQSWYLSQLSPDPLLADNLQRTGATCMFNTAKSQKGWAGKVISRIDNRITRLNNTYKSSQKIHAKVIISEDPGGRLSVISGSHNFARSGVQLGTREIALHSTDQALASTFIEFIRAT